MMARPLTSAFAAMPRTAALSITLLMLWAGAGLADAADKPRVGGFGQAKGGPLLTRAQLRDCLTQQDRVKAQGDEALKLRTRIEAEQADLVARGAQLKEQLAALDRSSQEAVDAYNAQAAERDKAIDALEERTTAYNARVEALQAEKATFAKACDNRRYDERDETDIRAGK